MKIFLVTCNSRNKRGFFCLNFKLYDMTTWLTNNCNTHIDQHLKKSNKRKKFGQLIQYSMKNTFLETSYTKCSGETTPRPFSKKSKLIISLDRSSKVLQSTPIWGLSKCIENKLKTTCFYLIYCLFKKQRHLELASLPHFLHVILEKIFFLVHSITWSKFIAWV